MQMCNCYIMSAYCWTASEMHMYSDPHLYSAPQLVAYTRYSIIYTDNQRGIEWCAFGRSTLSTASVNNGRQVAIFSVAIRFNIVAQAQAADYCQTILSIKEYSYPKVLKPLASKPIKPFCRATLLFRIQCWVPSNSCECGTDGVTLVRVLYLVCTAPC